MTLSTDAEGRLSGQIAEIRREVNVLGRESGEIKERATNLLREVDGLRKRTHELGDRLQGMPEMSRQIEDLEAQLERLERSTAERFKGVEADLEREEKREERRLHRQADLRMAALGFSGAIGLATAVWSLWDRISGLFHAPR